VTCQSRSVDLASTALHGPHHWHFNLSYSIVLIGATHPSFELPAACILCSKHRLLQALQESAGKGQLGSEKGSATMQAQSVSRTLQRRSPGADPGPPPNVPARSISPAMGVGTGGGVAPRPSASSTALNRSGQNGSSRRPNVSPRTQLRSSSESRCPVPRQHLCHQRTTEEMISVSATTLRPFPLLLSHI
jgi:hypothetical protein